MKFLNRKTSVGGDAVILTVSKFMTTIIGVVTSMLLARFRTLDEYGTYSQIIMVVDLVSTIFMLGLPNSVNYFLAKADTKEQKQKFMSVYLTLSTVLTAIIGLCLNITTPLIIEYFDNPMITTLSYVFNIYPWSMIMLNSLSNVCVVYGKSNKLIYFSVIHSVCNLLIILGAKIFSWSFGTYMLVYMLATLAFAVFAVAWICSLAGKIRPTLDFKLIKEMLVFCIPMGLASVVGTLNAELDKLVIANYFTTAEYAIFANAAKQLPVTMLTDSLTAVLLPCIVRLMREKRSGDVVKVWSNAINVSFSVMCLIAGGLFVFAPDIMELFYSAKYATPEGVAVFRVYTTILLLRCTYWGMVLNATGKTKFIFYSACISMVCNIIGNVVFYHLFGFVGPAISTLLITIVINFVQLKFTTKILNVGMKRIFPWLNMLKLLIQTVVIGTVFWLIKNIMLSDVPKEYSLIVSIGLGCIWAAVYCLVNYKMIRKNYSSLGQYK